MVTITLLLYIVATALLLVRVRVAASSQLLIPLKQIALASALIALTLHGYLLWEGIVTGFGLNLSLFLVISLTAWLINLIVISSSLFNPNENLAIITQPIAVVVMILAANNPQYEIIDLTASPGLKFSSQSSATVY